MAINKDIEFWTNQADEYFTEHLQSAQWHKLSAQSRRGALKLALVLIERLLSTPLDAEDGAQKTALFEEALYLSENYQSGSIRPQLSGETVAEIGSVTYRTNSAVGSGEVEYAPVVLRLLAPLLVVNQIIRG